MHRARVVVACVVVGALGAGVYVLSATGPSTRPDAVDLPRGFQPEGIAAGPGTSVFVGSIPTGAIYRADTRTGRGAVLVAGREGRAAIGVEEAGGRLYVAGGATGQAFLYDAGTGADIAALALGAGEQPAFINDVVVTAAAAYFTDSLGPVVYRVDRQTLAVTPLPLTGALVYEPGFNVNGIEATPDGRALVLVQTNTGRLFTADPTTGVTRSIDLAGGASLPGGDGLLLAGQDLYVVQNREDQVSIVRLAEDLATATVAGRITDPRFDAPTTVARSGDRLYVVNARVDLPDPATATYQVVAVDRPGP